MQDKYVGDIGDFSNNGLLRHLFGGPGKPIAEGERLRLGVIWYLNEKKAPVSDGQTIGYLVGTQHNLDRFRCCDWHLYDKLQRLVISDRRTVKAVQKDGILPYDTLFFGKSFQSYRRRTDWFEDAIAKVADAKLVFVNPDTGIASEAMEKNKRIGREHVSIHELQCLYKQGKSLVIYHHRPRVEAEEEAGKINELADKLGGKLTPCPLVRVLRWNRNPVRFYFIVPRPEHESFLAQRIEALKETKWCKKWPEWKLPHFKVER